MITRSRVALAATTITGLAAISPAMASASTNVAVCSQGYQPCHQTAIVTNTVTFQGGSSAQTGKVISVNVAGNKASQTTIVSATSSSDASAVNTQIIWQSLLNGS